MFTNSLSVGALVNVYPVAFDPTDSVRAGLTALPNAAAGADGGLLRTGSSANAGQLVLTNGLAIQAAPGDGEALIISNVGNSTTPPISIVQTTAGDLIEFNGTSYFDATALSRLDTNLDAAITSRMATYTQPTGFLAATFPTTVASTTNITAGTITTVTNLTNLPTIPSNWLTAAGIAASALDGKGNWNIGKTGYALTATTGLGNQTANITGNLSGSVGSVTGAVGSVTGNVGGNVVGSVGSISGVTFPTNFSALGINASGHISRVVLADTVTTLTNLPTAPANWLTASALATDAVNEIVYGVWNEVSTGYATPDSFGLLAISDYNSSVNSETVANKLNTALVLDGAVYQFTINALENAPSGSGASASAIADAVWDELLSGHTTTGSAGAELTTAASGGGGGGDNITVTPLQITAQEIPTYTINGATVWNISAAQNSTQGFLFAVLDGTGTAVNLSAKTLRFVLHSAKAPYAPYGELATSGSGITVGGGSNNQVTVTLTQALTARPFEGAYKLWNITDNVLLGSGSFSIKPAPNDF